MAGRPLWRKIWLRFNGGRQTSVRLVKQRVTRVSSSFQLIRSLFNDGRFLGKFVWLMSVSHGFFFFFFCFFSCWLLLVVAVLSLCSSLLARYFIFFDQLHRIITVLKVHYRANRQTDRKRRTDTENMQRWCLRAGLIIGSTPPVVTDVRTSGSRPLTNASVIITIVLCWKNSCESIHPPTGGWMDGWWMDG